MDQETLKGPFLDLLNSLHRWCNSSDTIPDTTDDWFTVSGLDRPANPDDWLRLGRTPMSEWGLETLPPGWQPAWRILSRHESTLTVEALDYLEEHIAGAIAAALPEPYRDSAPGLDSNIIRETDEHWSLEDMIHCVERELKRREEEFPGAVRDGRMTAEDAAQELSQMRAILHNLSGQRLDDSSPRPEMRDQTVADEQPRQGRLL